MNKSVLAAAVFSAAIALPVVAETEISVGAGVYDFDGDRNADNDVVGKIGLGHRYDSSPFGVELSYSDVSAETSANQSYDLSAFTLDGLYHFATSGKLTPYVVAGVGELTTDTAAGDDSDKFFNLGGGVKYALSEALDLRADLRGIRTDDTDMTDIAATLSFVFGLGGGAAAPVSAPVSGDADGDGVIDAVDTCPTTPAGVEVDASGCALDEDGDGVPDYKDECLGTAAGVNVDEKGCPVLVSEIVTFNLDVEFETDKATIRPGYTDDIENLATFLANYPDTEVVLGGHTDSVGSEAYNLALSQKRADAVKRALIVRGVSSDRVTAKGFGESRPIADNMVAAGRAENRRVVASVSAVKQVAK